MAIAVSYAAVWEKACGSGISTSLARNIRTHLDGHPLLEVLSDGSVSGLPEGQELGIVVGIRKDDDSSVVLGCRTEKGNSSNVDLLDGLCDRGSGDLGDRLVERVEVADDYGDGCNLLSLEVRNVRGDVTSEDTFGVDRQLWVTRIHGETSHLRGQQGEES